MPAAASNKQRFAIVGVANTTIDFGLLFALRSLGVPVAVANIVSTALAFMFSFAANKQYTFKTHSTSLVREMILFTIVTLFGLWVLQTGVIAMSLPILSELFGSTIAGLLAAKLLASIVTLLWNYIMYSRVVFVRREVR